MSRFKDFKLRFHDGFGGRSRGRGRKFKFNRDDNEDILDKPVLDDTDINKDDKNQGHGEVHFKFDDSDFGISRNNTDDLREINAEGTTLATGFKVLSPNTKDSSFFNSDDFKCPDDISGFIGDESLAFSSGTIGNVLTRVLTNQPNAGVLTNQPNAAGGLLNSLLGNGGPLGNLLGGLFGGTNSGIAPTTAQNASCIVSDAIAGVIGENTGLTAQSDEAINLLKTKLSDIPNVLSDPAPDVEVLEF